MHEEFTFGPHFDRDLIGPNGKLTRLHKGGGSSGPSSAELAKRQREQEKAFRLQEQQRAKEREAANHQFQSILSQQMAAMSAVPEIKLPDAPVIEPPDPEVKSGSVSKANAEKRAKRKAANAYGLSKTRVAGDTGGFQLGPQQSILGGSGAAATTSAT